MVEVGVECIREANLAVVQGKRHHPVEGGTLYDLTFSRALHALYGSSHSY